MQSFVKAYSLLALQVNWRRTVTFTSLSHCSSLAGTAFLASTVAWIVIIAPMSESHNPDTKHESELPVSKYGYEPWGNASQHSMMRMEDTQQNRGPDSTFDLYILKNSYGSDYPMTAVIFVSFIKSKWIREASEKAGEKFPCAIDCVHPSLSWTRKQHVGVDWFVYLAANVTFISGTLSIQSGRCLGREKNAKFSLLKLLPGYYMMIQ